MTVTAGEATQPKPDSAKGAERRALGVACGAHALHDGYTDLVYVMLPIWQSEFGLGFAVLGLMKTVFSGTLAGFQIPAGLLAERFGATGVLALGTALAGIGYVVAGFSSSVALLVAALFVGGLGASTQHPLASSLIAHAFAGKRSLRALGTYNFAGDIGKMTLPAAAALLLVVMPWREALILLGGLGSIAAVAIFVAMPRFRDEPSKSVNDDSPGPAQSAARAYAFPCLMVVGVIDSATRMAFLTFLPFVLTAKGASIQTVGVALTLDESRTACVSARIALGAVGPTPLFVPEAGAALAEGPLADADIERAAALAQATAKPISDMRGSADYRRHLVGVLVKRALRIAHERAKGG